MTSYMAMFTNSVLLPFYLQEILKYTPLVTGLLTLPYAIALTITAPISGNTAGKYGSRCLTVSGPFCMVLGLLLFTLCDQNTSVIQLILASAIMGMGNGLFQSPSNMAIMSCVKKNELGIASGILALSRNMGNILGVAITITLFDSIRTHYLNLHVIYQNAFMFAYKYTMICGMGFGIICLGLAFIAYKPENKTDCHSNWIDKKWNYKETILIFSLWNTSIKMQTGTSLADVIDHNLYKFYFLYQTSKFLMLFFNSL